MENYAFISYSHGDIRAVRRLHKRLETFKVPGFIRRHIEDCPKFVFPIFRDETDLSGTTLTPTIRQALDNSRWLIVVCSEASARSEWVAREIDAFLETHSPDRIIPVFLSNITRRSNGFPGCLQKLEQARANTQVYSVFSRKLFFFQIISRLLDCREPGLTSRYRSRYELFRLIKWVFGPILLLALYTEAPWQYQDHFDTVKYCTDVSFRYGWPDIAEEMNFLERLNADDYYILTYRSNRIVALEHIYPEEQAPSFPGHYLLETDRMEFAYNNYWVSEGNATARISGITFQDRDGQTLYVMNPSLTLDVADLTVSETDSGPFYLPEDMTWTDLKTWQIPEQPATPGFCRIGTVYDEAGRLSEVWFLSHSESWMVPDVNGWYGLSFVYDEAGEVCSVLGLDEDGSVLSQIPVS